MAKPTTLRSTKLLIELGDGANPEVFAAPCALTTKGLNFSATTTDTELPDCDDPDAATWTDRAVDALSAGVTGSGTLAMDALATWRTWFLSAANKNIRVKLDLPQASGGGYFAMSAVLSGFNLAGQGKGLATIEVTIGSSGEVSWVAAGA
jgi:hypothetical protein